ncbi:MAG: type II toxin-antitoxin system RelE/ParE family toxin [Candidatus Portnoybacteria bacterium]|nr:type II toxin-antitoxin system RelE/ParE family toxin [Candidatus Portnoybacteria bacterium]
MRLQFSEPFMEDYAELPREIKKRTDKQLHFLLSNLRHPSLQTRKLTKDPMGRTWYARITRDYRFTFEIKGDVYFLRRIGKHKLIEK